jgi:hypothetical protein
MPVGEFMGLCVHAIAIIVLSSFGAFALLQPRVVRKWAIWALRYQPESSFVRTYVQSNAYLLVVRFAGVVSLLIALVAVLAL